ncbi:MAG: hypothetical protein WBD39_14775, partial [Candidatus Acidiferrales bacterium]
MELSPRTNLRALAETLAAGAAVLAIRTLGKGRAGQRTRGVFGAIIALGYWYMYAMTNWVNHAVGSALAGKLGPGITVQEIGGVALSVWATHPLTLLIGYFIAEGAVRFSAVFSGEAVGTLPLFLCD